jgi:hypothetical protein
MKLFLHSCAVAAALCILGCSSGVREERSAPTPPASPAAAADSLTDLAAVPSDQPEEPLPDTELMARAEVWSPRYVQTGLASGIMVEFTGLKKGKTLQAKFANIELRRCLGDSAALAARVALPPVSGPMRAQTTINNLHQAFFKVQPGRYFLRLTNPWADRRMVRDLEVKDGQYAVLANDVYAAWLKRTRQAGDSASVKP